MHRRTKVETQVAILFINYTLCIVSMGIMTCVYFDKHFSAVAYACKLIHRQPMIYISI
jgi:hypothetical protein